MLSLLSEWNAIAARIEGVVDASRLYLTGMSLHYSDPFNAADREILPQAQAIYQTVSHFVLKYRDALPGAAVDGLERFLEKNRDHFSAGNSGGIDGLRMRAIALVALRSEIQFHLADFSFAARRLSERAFLHLKRGIVADATIRAKWREAFKEGEPACERLGATHLLQHGIWAFKAYAAGERTDLLFGEPLRDLTEVESAAEALVLTEWKIVRDRDGYESVAQSARGQAAQYAKGALGGIELGTHRYIVLVSEHGIPPIADVTLDHVIYRHIDVPVDPASPSRAAKRAVQTNRD